MARKADHQYKLWLTEEEYIKLKKKARGSGLTMKDYILRSSFDKEITNTNVIRDLLPEISRIGNNLNQIARRINSGEVPSQQEVKANQKELAEIWQSLKRFLPKRR